MSVLALPPLEAATSAFILRPADAPPPFAQFHGSHGALGDRARKLDQGILVIRFEMVGRARLPKAAAANAAAAAWVRRAAPPSLCAVPSPPLPLSLQPFNTWCSGCGHLIGKGVRFNAEKQQ